MQLGGNQAGVMGHVDHKLGTHVTSNLGELLVWDLTRAIYREADQENERLLRDLGVEILESGDLRRAPR